MAKSEIDLAREDFKDALHTADLLQERARRRRFRANTVPSYLIAFDAAVQRGDLPRIEDGLKDLLALPAGTDEAQD